MELLIETDGTKRVVGTEEEIVRIIGLTQTSPELARKPRRPKQLIAETPQSKVEDNRVNFKHYVSKSGRLDNRKLFGEPLSDLVGKSHLYCKSTEAARQQFLVGLFAKKNIRIPTRLFKTMLHNIHCYSLKKPGPNEPLIENREEFLKRKEQLEHVNSKIAPDNNLLESEEKEEQKYEEKYQ